MSKSALPLTLRAKVMLILTLLFCVLTGFATFKAVRSFDEIKKDRRTEFEWMGTWIESEQQRKVALARQVALSVMNEIRKGLTKDDCKIGLVGSPGLDPEFGQFAIADPQGNVSCNSIPWLQYKNVADQDYFKQALRLVNTGVITEASDHNPNLYRAMKARAMRDREGHVQSVILVAMDFSWVNKEINRIHLPADGHLMLVDERGNVIDASANLAHLVARNIAEESYYKRYLDAPDEVFDGLGISGLKSLVIMHPIKTDSGIYHFYMDAPIDSLLQPAYASLYVTVAGSLVVFLVILGLTYIWSDRFFLRRLTAIMGVVRKYSDGDLSARINSIAADELGNLARTIDATADSLRSKTAEVIATNEELYRINRALKVLSAGNKSLLFAKTEQELLERICRDIVEQGGYLAAWIGFAGPSHDRYLRTMASYSQNENETDRMDWNKAGNGMEPVITAVREDKVLVINDTSHESVHKHLAEQALKFGYRSIIILPLHLEGQPFGALILTAYRENEFGDTQVHYLKETALDTSFGIEMMRTKGERNRLALQEEHHELVLRNSLEDALRAIAMTIEMRDPYTAGHQRRVADLALAIAKELGLSDEEAHGVYLAGVVHDIGKINVPTEILVKPGRLTELEYQMVRAHVTSSYDILKGISFPWPLADIVHQHHERMDGSGYPLRLKSGDILFGGRILAVADVVEAMSSHRPYRAGLGIEVALAEIERERGVLYDPTVADACLRLFREGRFNY